MTTTSIGSPGSCFTSQSRNCNVHHHSFLLLFHHLTKTFSSVSSSISPNLLALLMAPFPSLSKLDSRAHPLDSLLVKSSILCSLALPYTVSADPQLLLHPAPCPGHSVPSLLGGSLGTGPSEDPLEMGSFCMGLLFLLTSF